MSAELKRIAGIVMALCAAGVAACSDSGPECVAGTTEKDGVCTATPPAPVTCGPGTVEKDGACVVEEEPVATCTPACSAGFVCDTDGTCVPGPRPVTWACVATAYNDGTSCDCGCAAPDPDCAVESLPVTGCASGRCNDDGTCVACEPQCSGKECGDDGCGGFCGSCLASGKPVCTDGRCAACVPQCDGRTCGADGCGGTCGSCRVGETCADGTCSPPHPTASCAGHCGEVTESGCSCGGDCAARGNCCVDYVLCGCQPTCTGKQCGDDGCGGICGFCASTDRCAAGTCVDDLCDPDPCRGNGTCRPADGSCACATGFAGDTCGTCAPGYTNYPRCIPDQCVGRPNACTGHGRCAPATGACACDEGFGGVSCERCESAEKTWPSCAP